MPAGTKLDRTLRGFLLPDQRFTPASVSTADSSYTEAGPRPCGVGTPDDPTSSLVVATSGDQDADLSVTVTQGGMPGTRAPVRVAYRYESETDDALRGWNSPNLALRFKAVDLLTAFRTKLAAVTLPDQRLLLAASSVGSGSSLYTYDPVTDTVTAGLVGLDIGNPEAFCVLSTGRVLSITTATSALGAAMFYSDDAGTTWTKWAQDCLSPVTTVRGRLFHLPGGELVYVACGLGTLTQYASSSLGSTWTTVETWAHGGGYLADACVTASGKVGAVVLEDTTGFPRWFSVGSPYLALSSAPIVEIDAVALDEAWVVADPAGSTYVYGRRQTSDEIVVWRTDDDGASWVSMSYGVQHNASTTAFISLGQAVHAGGAVWMFHSTGTGVPGATWGTGANLLGLGGWSTLTSGQLPGTATPDGESSRYAWGAASANTAHLWFPSLGEPHNVGGWTAAGTGVDADDTLDATSGAFKIVTSGTSRYQTAAVSPSGTSGVLIVSGAVESGGSIASAVVGSALRLGDGTGNAREVRIHCTTTGFRVYDQIAGSTLANVTVNMTLPIQIATWMSWSANRTEVYYRRPWSPIWLHAYGTATSVLGSTVSATTWARWGNIASGTATSTWRLAGFHDSLGAAGIVCSASPVAAGREIMGRGLSARPVPLYDRATGGDLTTYLRAVDGPGRLGEVHSLPAGHDYPVENVFHQVQPSPRTTFRTITDTVDTIIAWVPGDGVDVTSMTKSIGLFNANANFRTAYIEGQAGGGAWDTLVSLDNCTSGSTGLTYLLTGNVMRCQGGWPSDRYVQRNEHVGDFVILNGTYARRILRHTEGVWGGIDGSAIGTVAKRAEFVLEGLDGTEPPAATFVLIKRSGVAVSHDIHGLYDRYRIRIPAQVTPDGFFECGILLPGAVQAVGQDYGWGHTAVYEPQAETNTSRDGVSRVRRLGPVTRTWSWSWVDGVDVTRLRGVAPTPDWVGSDATTTDGMANAGDVPWLLAGILEELRSGEVPVVAIASIPDAAGTVTDPTLFLYGRLVSSISVENVMGDEGVDELVRVNTVTIKEIP